MSQLKCFMIVILGCTKSISTSETFETTGHPKTRASCIETWRQGQRQQELGVRRLQEVLHYQVLPQETQEASYR